jgi:hypothetical protein
MRHALAKCFDCETMHERNKMDLVQRNIDGETFTVRVCGCKQNILLNIPLEKLEPDKRAIKQVLSSKYHLGSDYYKRQQRRAEVIYLDFEGMEGDIF